MKYFSILLFLIASCIPQSKEEKPLFDSDSSQRASREIWETDESMSEMAVKEGFQKTLLVFADDSLIKPEQGSFPVIGKKALEENWRGKDDFNNLSWKPFRAEAATSGDLGYTIGNWKMVTPDTTYYGNYYTIWKRQPDGKWKWIVDGGNDTPAPK